MNRRRREGVEVRLVGTWAEQHRSHAGFGTGVRLRTTRRLARVPMIGEEVVLDAVSTAVVVRVVWELDGTPTVTLGAPW